MPIGTARRHLRALSDVGLVSAATRGGVEVYALVQHAVSLLSTSLVYGLSGGKLPERRKEDVLPASVPRPPLGCTLCDNASFVGEVLDDLGAALDEARVYHDQIQEMSSRILTAHEEERKRIARELHDDTAQAITSILVRLRLLERSAEDAEVLENVEELRELTSDALDSVRRMAMDLRPAALDDLGLLPALQSYAEQFSHSTPIAVSMEVEGLGRRLPRDVELVLYRVFQEALTNVSKHASATTALVQVKRKGNEVTFVIEDDGDGFDPGSLSPTQGSGLGLFGMRERLTLVGGAVEVESAKGKGTRIVARVPLGKKLGAGR
jgi:signal transduction histidine kinase